VIDVVAVAKNAAVVAVAEHQKQMRRPRNQSENGEKFNK